MHHVQESSSPHKKWRRFFYFVSFSIYIFMFILLLECFALGLQVWIETSNPLIAALKRTLPLPLPARPVQVVPSGTYYPAGTVLRAGGATGAKLFADDSSMQQVLGWGPRDVHGSEATQQARRSAFPSLSSAAREAYARLNGEMVFKIDEEYRIQAIYGADRILASRLQRTKFHFWLRYSSKMKDLRAAVDRSIESRSPQSTIAEGLDGNPVRISCIRVDSSKEPGGVFLFFEAHPEVTFDRLTSQDKEDSRYEVFGYRLKKNYQGSKEDSFCTNSLGFRDDEIALFKPRNQLRILCIGGSTTEEGATNHSTYPHLLETRLSESFPGCSFDVINGGISGATISDHLLRFSDYLKLEPDLIILHLGVNDIQVQYRQPMVNFLPRISHFIQIFFPSISAPSLTTFSRRHKDHMVFSLELFMALAQRNGIPVALASMDYPDPSLIDKRERQYFDYQERRAWYHPAFALSTYTKYIRASNQMLSCICREYDAFYFPVEERIVGSINIFRDFCHMTSAGIEAKASVIFDSMLPLVEQYCQSKTPMTPI